MKKNKTNLYVINQERTMNGGISKLANAGGYIFEKFNSCRY